MAYIRGKCRYMICNNCYFFFITNTGYTMGQAYKGSSVISIEIKELKMSDNTHLDLSMCYRGIKWLVC